MNKKFKIYIMLIATCIINIIQGGMQSPGMGGFSMPSIPSIPSFPASPNQPSMAAQGFDPAAMGGMAYDPTMMQQNEKEMQDAMDFLKRLDESNSPEDIALKKEIERMSLELSANMTDADMDQLSKAFGIPIADLKATRDEAIAAIAASPTQPDTDAEEPEEEAQSDDEKEEYISRTPSTTKVPGKKGTPEETTQLPTATEKQKTQKMIERLVERLGSLKQKSVSPTVSQMLRRWEQELRDLTYYLQVVNTDARIEPLITASGGKLLKNINLLATVLSTQEPQISITDSTSTDSPYTRLGVKKKDSTAKIEKAYKKLVAASDAKAIEKRLKKAKASDADIKRETRLAELKVATITEDYEALIDKKSREQIDRALDAAEKEHRDEINRARGALAEITNALSSAIFNQSLLTQFEDLLKKIAPKELEKQKEMKKEEEKRRKEQAHRATARPQQTPGGRLEPTLQTSQGPTSGYQPDYSSFGGFPGSFGYEHPGFQTSPAQASTQQQPTDKKDQPAATTTSTPNTNALEEAKRIDPRSITAIINDIKSRIQGMATVFGKESTQELFDPKKDFLYKAPTKKGPLPTDEIDDTKVVAALGSLYADLKLFEATKDMGKLVDKLQLTTRVQLPTADETAAWRSLMDEFGKAPSSSSSDQSVKEWLEELGDSEQGHIKEYISGSRAFKNIYKKIQSSTKKLTQGIEEAKKLFKTKYTATGPQAQQQPPTTQGKKGLI